MTALGLASVFAHTTIAAYIFWRRAGHAPAPRVQHEIDHRFYRRRYEAVLTLAAFSAVVRGEVELGHHCRRLLDVAHGALEPQQVWLWLPAQDRGRD